MGTFPTPPVNEFTTDKAGFFGEFGAGNNARVRFIQTAFSADELEKVWLIQKIAGSEKWKVRDLFQRNVDGKRVTDKILPYLKDERKVKFFAPLTLVLLPKDTADGGIDRKLLSSEESLRKEGEHEYRFHRVKNHFQFKVHTTSAQFSEVQWNPTQVHLVAIDGQHRLSALRRWMAEPGPNPIRDWQIPVIILGITKEDEGGESEGILDVVRKTFVNINSRAEKISDNRLILLDDEDVLSLCTQQMIEESHANDVREFGERDPKKLPLLFFNWRDGREENEHSASVIDISELKAWFEHYLIGEKHSDMVAKLELKDEVPPITEQDLETLSHENSEKVRKKFDKFMRPGLSHLLEGFKPFADYREELRKLEDEALGDKSDIALHAFARLRFGPDTGTVPGDIREDVKLKHAELVLDVARAKPLHSLESFDVGRRGLVAAFRLTKDVREVFRGGSSIPWLDHAKWFVPKVNKVYEKGWFNDADMLDPEQKDALKYVVWDPDFQQRINYRLEDVKHAFGVLLALLVIREDEDKTLLEAAWDELVSEQKFESSVSSGIRKEVKADWERRMPKTSERAENIKKETRLRTIKWVGQLRHTLGL